MPAFKRALQLLLAMLTLMSMTIEANAHVEAEPLWAMSTSELNRLEQTIEQHRLELVIAMNDAITAGFLKSSGQRDFAFDSSSEVVDIPRSVLNRVIFASLQLEAASMEKYIGCSASCEHSLEKDLGGDPQKAKALGVARQLWPKMKASFALLWRDIPVGTWMRMINAARYSRSLRAGANYQAKAYGRFSMIMGAAAFGAAFSVTEVAESMFMGPLHFVCKANYFWSVALGAAVAGLSRDLKTLLMFEKDGLTLIKRISNAMSGFANLQRRQRLEKRILFRALSDGSSERFEKLTRRGAHAGVLETLLGRVAAAQAVAIDPLLWSDLATSVASSNGMPIYRRFRIATDEREFLFESEVDGIYEESESSARATARWQDMNASMRVVLQVFRNGLEVRDQLRNDAGEALKALGELDLLLRTLDILILAQLNSGVTRSTKDSAAWLKEVTNEWLSLAIDTSSTDADLRAADLRAIEIRRRKLKASLEASVESGLPIGLTTDGKKRLRNSIQAEAFNVASRASACETLFITQ